MQVPHTLAGTTWGAEEEGYVRHLLSICDRFAPGTSDLVRTCFVPESALCEMQGCSLIKKVAKSWNLCTLKVAVVPHMRGCPCHPSVYHASPVYSCHLCPAACVDLHAAAIRHLDIDI